MIEVLEYQVISKDRRTKPNMPLTETEKTQFRGLVGSMGWITRQTRPDVLVNVSMAAQTMGKPTVRDGFGSQQGRQDAQGIQRRCLVFQAFRNQPVKLRGFHLCRQLLCQREWNEVTMWLHCGSKPWLATPRRPHASADFGNQFEFNQESLPLHLGSRVKRRADGR